MENKHSFARVWLNRLGNQVLINGRDFFKYKFDDSEFVNYPLKTFISVGQGFEEEEEERDTIIPMDYNDLRKEHNIACFKISAQGKGWRKMQHYIYILAKKKHGQYGELTPDQFAKRSFKIEHDPIKKRFRGVGEGFGTLTGQYGAGDITPWYTYGKTENNRSNRIVSVYDDYADVTEAWYEQKMGGDSNSSITIDIPECPVMITEDGRLLCIPKVDVLPKILIVGKSGKGKSFTLNSIMGRLFWSFHYRCGLLNDSLNQFYDLSLPNPDFETELRRVGNHAKFLPTINLYMSCPGVKIKYMEENVGYRLVLSFKHFLYTWKYWTDSVTRWSLDGKESYLEKGVIEQLHKCKTVDEVRSCLYQTLPNANDEKKGDGIRNMIEKWCSKFDNLFRDQFLDVLFQDELKTAAEWELKMKNGKQYVGHPFIISMYAGLFPVVNNYMAKSRDIAPKQMADLIRKITQWQMMLEDDKLPVMIGIDELKDMLDKKGRDVYSALNYLFTQGRFPKVGFIGNVQEYTKLSNEMQANSTHLIVFELQTDKERKAIAKDYNLDKHKLEEMSELKTFQCLFITKERTVLYDRDGRKVEFPEGGIWKGKVLPPISTHKTPT